MNRTSSQSSYDPRLRCTDGGEHEPYNNSKTGKIECKKCGLELGNYYDQTLEKRMFGEKEDEGRKRADYSYYNPLSIFDEDAPPTKKGRGGSGESTTIKSRYKREYLKSQEKIRSICDTIKFDISENASKLLLEYYRLLFEITSRKKAANTCHSFQAFTT